MSTLLPGDALRSLDNALRTIADRIGDAVGKDDHPPLDLVDHVDIERYSGLWYELARLPMRFQADETVSTAEYTPMTDGGIRVHNRAWRGTKLDSEITGTAVPAKGAEESANRLIVRFGGLLKFIPVSKEDGNYCVLALTPDYSLALVGTPDRRSMWLLARDQVDFGSPETEAFLAVAAEQGFDTDALLIADWKAGATRPR